MGKKDIKAVNERETKDYESLPAQGRGYNRKRIQLPKREYLKRITQGKPK